MVGLQVVLVQRVRDQWRVGIGAVTAQPHQFDGEIYGSIRAAKRAAHALAKQSGLLIVHSDLPRALRGDGEDLD